MNRNSNVLSSGETEDYEVELSVVMPCLDEADTVATCIGKAVRAMAEHDISGEVVIADNGSRDASVEIAERAGARVVHVAERGYGSALMGGFDAARGRYLIMGDADLSYDFGEGMRKTLRWYLENRDWCDGVGYERERLGMTAGGKA